MKILHIIDTLAPGGAERMCLTSANLFASRGYAVTVLEILKPGPLGEFLNPAIQRISLNRKSKWDFTTMRRLANVMREHDVVHVHMRHVYRYVFLVNLKVRKKLILHDHFNTFLETQATKTVFQFLLRKNMYACVNQDGKKWATDFLNLLPDQVFNVPNIIMPGIKKDKSKGGKLVLVSNIKPEKHVEFIIPLAAELVQKDASIKIDVIGKVMDEVYHQEIQSRLKTAGVDHMINFITNVNSVQEVLNTYSLGLHFSKRESGPLVLLEYLAQDLPFVAYRTGEIAEKLNKSLPMFFLTNHDVVAWSEKIIGLLHHKIDYPGLNTVFNANNDIEEYFNQWLTIYKRSLY